jgi:uncharacterized protein
VSVNAEIKSVCKQIVDNFQPEKVVLFGSYAYGTPTEDSDIDLLVVMPYTGNELEQMVKVRRRLKSKYPLDVLVKTAAQLKARNELGDFFIQEILEKGKILYETKNARMD